MSCIKKNSVMKFKDLSITFHTHRIGECKEFYSRYFDVRITFDCEWYVTINFQSAVNPYIFLSFMVPQNGGPSFAGEGTTLNLMVDDVDEEYEKLMSKGVDILEPIADHPWGDRSFTITDPIGNILYIWSERPMSEVYRNAVKE